MQKCFILAQLLDYSVQKWDLKNVQSFCKASLKLLPHYVTCLDHLGCVRNWVKCMLDIEPEISVYCSLSSPEYLKYSTAVPNHILLIT